MTANEEQRNMDPNKKQDDPPIDDLDASIKEIRENINHLDYLIAMNKRQRKDLLKTLTALERHRLVSRMDEETAESVVTDLIIRILGHTTVARISDLDHITCLHGGEKEYIETMLVTPRLKGMFKSAFESLSPHGLCSSDVKHIFPSTDMEWAAVERLGITWPHVATRMLE